MLSSKLIFQNSGADKEIKVMPEFNTPQSGLADYRQAKPLFWEKVYGKGGKTLYSREAISKNVKRLINVEHVFPMSWAANTVGCGDRDQCRRYSDRFNQIEADMHNMYPSRRDLNYERGSLSFGIVKGEERNYDDFDFEIDLRKRIIEPTLESRGNIARSMLYMADAYDLKIFSKQFRMLKSWHDQDLPDEREILRNDLIEKVQGNRNYFIDHPKNVQFL
jgi:deoxyribonuclease-1